MQRVLGEMLGREGAERALDHVPTMPSGTEYLGSKDLHPCSLDASFTSSLHFPGNITYIPW